MTPAPPRRARFQRRHAYSLAALAQARFTVGRVPAEAPPPRERPYEDVRWPRLSLSERTGGGPSRSRPLRFHTSVLPGSILLPSDIKTSWSNVVRLVRGHKTLGACHALWSLSDSVRRLGRPRQFGDSVKQTVAGGVSYFLNTCVVAECLHPTRQGSFLDVSAIKVREAQAQVWNQRRGSVCICWRSPWSLSRVSSPRAADPNRITRAGDPAASARRCPAGPINSCVVMIGTAYPAYA